MGKIKSLKKNIKSIQFKLLYSEGRERNFLTKKTANKDTDLNFYKKLMSSYYNEEEILNLLEDPKKFFSRAWFFIGDKETAFSIYRFPSYYLMGNAYRFKILLPDEFWENPKLVKKFFECSDKLWENPKLVKKLFGYNDKNLINLIYKRPLNKSLECYRLGIEMAIVKAQVETIERLQKNFTNYALKKEKFEKDFPELEQKQFKDFEEKKAAFDKKMEEIESIPLYTFSLKDSKKSYKAIRKYVSRDTMGLIKHESHGLYR